MWGFPKGRWLAAFGRCMMWFVQSVFRAEASSVHQRVVALIVTVVFTLMSVPAFAVQ